MIEQGRKDEEDVGNSVGNDRIKTKNQRVTNERNPLISLIWRPQGDSNPCCRRERPVSLASRRWGPSLLKMGHMECWNAGILGNSRC